MAQVTVQINGTRLDERIEYGHGGTLIVFREPDPAITIYREVDGDPLTIIGVNGDEIGFTVNIPEGGAYPIEGGRERIFVEHGVNS